MLYRTRPLSGLVAKLPPLNRLSRGTCVQHYSVGSTGGNSRIKHDILEKSLEYVHALGWTENNIAQSVLDLGMPPLSHRLLDRGAVEIVEHFLENKRKHVREHVKEFFAQRHSVQSKDHDISYGVQDGATSDSDGSDASRSSEKAHNGTGTEGGAVDTPNVSQNSGNSHSDYTSGSNSHTHRNNDSYDNGSTGCSGSSNSSSSNSCRDKLEVALHAHMQFLAPYRSSWPAAMALLFDPRNVTYSVRSALGVVEDLCQYADVTASRMNWYTERGLLLGLYTANELYMLADDSENLKDTR